jgi:N-acetylglucosaminyldiphosphoundecaprenol N-acetyl-beta-D-mannosaminyltransferase
MTVGFYGGAPTVIEGIKERVARDLPELRIVYAYSPPFRPLTDDEDDEVVVRINEANPDILFMGLGCPKQEKWMADHRKRLTTVMLGVGASFDFYAGKVRECPPWLGRLGLEWMFRLTQEPKRLWRRYLILNPRFMLLAAAQVLGLQRSNR